MGSSKEVTGGNKKRDSVWKRLIKKIMPKKQCKRCSTLDEKYHEGETTDRMGDITVNNAHDVTESDSAVPRHITYNVNGPIGNLNLNINSNATSENQYLCNSQNILRGGQRNERKTESYSMQESAVGWSGNTQLVSGLINEYEPSDDDICYEDLRKLKSEIKTASVEKKSIPDDKHFEGHDSCIGREKNISTSCNSESLTKGNKQDILHLTDIGMISSFSDERKVSRSPRETLHKSLENDHCDVTSEDRHVVHREKSSKLQTVYESACMTSDNTWNLPDKENEMRLSTFENDRSNVKPYFGQPELESQIEMEELMEGATTIPKERDNSMCLQKENLPLPDPVPAHEETQLKQTVAEGHMTDSEPKSSSYEISSGYPVFSYSSKTERKCSDRSFVSSVFGTESQLTARDGTRFSAKLGSTKLKSLQNFREKKYVSGLSKYTSDSKTDERFCSEICSPEQGQKISTKRRKEKDCQIMSAPFYGVGRGMCKLSGNSSEGALQPYRCDIRNIGARNHQAVVEVRLVVTLQIEGMQDICEGTEIQDASEKSSILHEMYIQPVAHIKDETKINKKRSEHVQIVLVILYFIAFDQNINNAKAESENPDNGCSRNLKEITDKDYKDEVRESITIGAAELDKEKSIVEDVCGASSDLNQDNKVEDKSLEKGKDKDKHASEGSPAVEVIEDICIKTATDNLGNLQNEETEDIIDHVQVQNSPAENNECAEVDNDKPCGDKPTNAVTIIDNIEEPEKSEPTGTDDTLKIQTNQSDMMETQESSSSSLDQRCEEKSICQSNENTCKSSENEIQESIGIGGTEMDRVNSMDKDTCGATENLDQDCTDENKCPEERKEDTLLSHAITHESLNIKDKKETKYSDKNEANFKEHDTQAIDGIALGTFHTEKLEENDEIASSPKNVETITENIEEQTDEGKKYSIAVVGQDPGNEDNHAYEESTVTDVDKKICNIHLPATDNSEVIENVNCQIQVRNSAVENSSVCAEIDHVYDEKFVSAIECHVERSDERSDEKESTVKDYPMEVEKSTNDSTEMEVHHNMYTSFEARYVQHTSSQPDVMLEKEGGKECYDDDSVLESLEKQKEVMCDHESSFGQHLSKHRAQKNKEQKERKKKAIVKQTEHALESLGGTECIKDNQLQTLTPLRTITGGLDWHQKVEINPNQKVEKPDRNQNSDKNLTKANINLDSCDSVVDDTGRMSNDSDQSRNVSAPASRVKLVREKRNKRSSYFCKYCHRSREKPNNKCFNHKHDTSSRTIHTEIVRSFEHGYINIGNEWESTDSVSNDTISIFDSGVFSEFVSGVSVYTCSYESLKTNFKFDYKAGKKGTDVSQNTSEAINLEELKRLLAIEELRSQERRLKGILKSITSSWSYFRPESFSPYLYPGLASYFERIQNGDQLSLRERYSYEWIRFQSFDQYRGNGSGIVLARNGFYHDRDNGSTATRCYACDATYSEWEYFDSAEERHRPDCPHRNGTNSGNIPIQHEAGNDMEASAQRPRDPSAADPNSGNFTATSEAAETGEETATKGATSATGATADPLSVDMLRKSMEQASINSQTREGFSSQPTHDRENQQYMTSYAAHRETNTDSLVTSQLSQNRRGSAEAVPSNQYTGQSLPNPHMATVLNRSRIPAGAQSGTPGGAVGSQLTTTSLPASISQPTATSEATTLSQPVAVSEPSAVSQLATSGQPIAAAINESQAVQASAQALAGARRLETPGVIQIHPELIIIVEPKHPEYAAVDSRADTFRGTWPENLDQTPRRMAEAGFFYTGVADFTRCYACGGGLRNWEPGDDPVIEHTRWYPTCPYVSRLKGDKYVQAVVVKQQQHLEEKRRQQTALSQQRAAQQNPPDPLRTQAANLLAEMGYSQERIKDAILAVRSQTGKVEVTAEQALTWILDDDERRSTIAAQRAAGSSAFTASTRSQAVEASTSSSSATSAASTSSSSATYQSSATASSSTSQQVGTAGNQRSGGNGNQPSGSGNESLEAAGNQQGATGGVEDSTSERGESPKQNGTRSKKKRNRRGRQNASLPAEGATGNSGNLNPPADTHSLREENEKLRDIQTCKICLDKPVDTTFLPCGHLVCCGSCASKMRKCPICRKLIKGMVKTFMS